MKLFICEKPSQGRDIARIVGATKKSEGCLVGNGVTVTWAFGHLLEMAPPESYGDEYKKWRMETLPVIPNNWQLTVKKESAKQFKIIKGLIKKATSIVIATDADREGEVIAREIMDSCKWQGQTYRLWLSALDDSSIKKALANINPGDKTYPLYQAGLARSRADWLVGMNMTRAFTLLAQNSGYNAVLSIGRVQTPTLRLVVERDLTIANFILKPYWAIQVNMAAHNFPGCLLYKPASFINRMTLKRPIITFSCCKRRVIVRLPAFYLSGLDDPITLVWTYLCPRQIEKSNYSIYQQGSYHIAKPEFHQYC